MNADEPTDAELRSASDDLLALLSRLHELEVAKRGLTPGTPEMKTLATEVETLARLVLGRAAEETVLAESVADPAGRRPIEEAGPREMSIVLDEWRDAERRLREAGTAAERAAAEADFARLRAEYSRRYRELQET